VRLVTDWKISGRHSVSIAYAPRGERHYFKELSMSEYIPQDKQDDSDVEGHVQAEGESRHFLNELPDGEGGTSSTRPTTTARRTSKATACTARKAKTRSREAAAGSWTPSLP
jgi:hypothetical protein